MIEISGVKFCLTRRLFLLEAVVAEEFDIMDPIEPETPAKGEQAAPYGYLPCRSDGCKNQIPAPSPAHSASIETAKLFCKPCKEQRAREAREARTQETERVDKNIAKKVAAAENLLKKQGRIAQKSAEEKEQQAAEAKRQRAREEQEAIKAFDSKDPCLKDAALEILSAERGITKASLVDRVYSLLMAAAKIQKIVPNIFLFRNGIVQALASIRAGRPIPLVIEGDDYVPNEPLLWRKELYSCWDAAEGWREDARTFEQYLDARYQDIVDVAARARTLGKDFDEFDPEGPYRKWAAFFPAWQPTLRPDYTQKQMRDWFAGLSEVINFLLVACRNSGKSLTIAIWLIGAFLCCADQRVLLVSETTPLSDAFCSGIRSWFEISNIHELTPFQRLHPELTIDAGKKSDKYEHPLRHLGFFQPALQSTSCESTGQAGQRCSILWATDPLSDRTTQTEDQREKTIARLDALRQLIDMGWFIMDSTPWHPADATAIILDRNQKSDGTGLSYIIDPGWTLKPGSKSKPLYEITEDDIESYLCPVRIGWKVLSSKRRDNDEYTFRSQTLCEFIDKNEDASLKLHYDRIWITRNTIQAAPPAGVVYGTADLAFSKSKYRDRSCMTLFRQGDGADKNVYVLTQEAGQWTTQEKAEVFVRLTRQYPQHFRTWIIERPSNWEDIERAIKVEASKYGVEVPIYWATAPVSLDAKFHALKSMEYPLQSNKLRFVAGPYLELLTNELENLDDTGPKRRSSSAHKDDCAESLQLGCRFLLPDPSDEAAEVRKKLEEERYESERNKEMYALIYGGESRYRHGADPTPSTQDDLAPASSQPNRVLDALRQGNYVKDPSKKQIGFGSLSKDPRTNQD